MTTSVFDTAFAAAMPALNDSLGQPISINGIPATGIVTHFSNQEMDHDGDIIENGDTRIVSQGQIAIGDVVTVLGVDYQVTDSMQTGTDTSPIYEARARRPIADYFNRTCMIYRMVQTGVGIMNQPLEKEQLIRVVRGFYRDRFPGEQQRPINVTTVHSMLVLGPGTEIKASDVVDVEGIGKVRVIAARNPGGHNHRIECEVERSE